MRGFTNDLNKKIRTLAGETGAFGEARGFTKNVNKNFLT